MTRRMKARDRNERLFSLLRLIREQPTNLSYRDEWIVAAQDLVIAVQATQFRSLKDHPDREDLEQAALLEFHRAADKLAKHTDLLTPDNLFRILYSVAKFSMIRELDRIRKRGTMREDPLPDCWFEQQDFDEVELGHPAVPSPEEDYEMLMRMHYLERHLPARLVQLVDDRNLYRHHSKFAAPVRFVALQRLCGRWPSSAFVRSYWRIAGTEIIMEYGDFLARSAVASLSTANVL